MKCPTCGHEGTGNFCANCAAPLVGATCNQCHAPLTPGAKFCHRCGTPAGAQGVRPSGVANALPWSVAAIALLSVIALVAGQRFGRSRAAESEPSRGTEAPAAAPAGRAPDISSMSPP